MRDRTADLLRAKQALSQLSYSPVSAFSGVVGLGGLEPPTSPLSGVRSNQLSYRPADYEPAAGGHESATFVAATMRTKTDVWTPGAGWQFG